MITEELSTETWFATNGQPGLKSGSNSTEQREADSVTFDSVSFYLAA